MYCRERNVLALIFIFLLAATLLLFSPHGPSRAQEQSPPPPPQTPPKHMRRVRGQQPRVPAPAGSNQNQTSAEDDVVRVDTDLASILLTAIDKDHRFITTLKKEDVRVLEDDRPQEVTDFERETDLPLTIAILIDTSRSQEGVLQDEKTAAHTFIDSIIRPDHDRVAVISFTGEAVLQQSLTGNLAELRGAVERVVIDVPSGDTRCQENDSPERDPRCWTGVWDAAWVTVDQVLSQTPAQTRRAIIMLTDGDDTSSQTSKQEAIDFAVKNNVVVYSIGIHDNEFKDGKLAKGELRKISERTGGRAFFPENKQELDAAFAQIQQELRSQYLISYTPSNRKRDGTFRQVKIEITNPELRKQKLTLLYRQGYYARRG